MKNQANRGTGSPESSGKPLRQKAEEVAREKESRPSKNFETMSPEETRRNLHELLVHQIELEMQNDELHRAQAELEDVRARYLNLYDMAPVGYCTISEKGLILEINLTAAGMLEVARGLLINMPLSKFIYKEDQDIYYLHRRQIFEACEPQAYDLRMTKRDGTVFWAHLDAICLDTGGIPVCRVALSDITDRKRAEEAMRESEKRAVALVKELEQSDKNKNQFISVLSHELRNPLAAISAGVQILDITRDINQIANVKEIIHRQTSQLCKLVDDLLELTRISQNKIKLKKENINLNEIVKSAVEDIRLEYENKGVKLGTEIQASPIILNADSVRITQIIGNILFNALKFTQANGAVWLTLKQEEDYAVICVKDNGIGISPEILPYLFTPFTQADNSLDRSGGGLGLGLSIAKGIADLHEGDVSVYSDGLGKGSAFTIRLPVSEDEKLMMDKPIPDIADKTSLKLLIIEDNRDFADLLSTMLSAIGYTVNIAYNGEDGVNHAKRIKPDVIFCDIGLPGMNGYDVAGSIRNDKDLKDVYLIALTGYAGEGDAERILKAGFSRHLAKPVDLATLKNALL